MKRIIITTFCLFAVLSLWAQTDGVSINNTGNAPDSSAIFDVQSNNKGILIPRMNTSQRGGISNPAIGLLVYDTDTDGFWYYSGASWLELTSNLESGTIQGTGIDSLNIRATKEGSVIGDSRGKSSVDLQTSRNAATQVASGENTVISGGSNNTASNYHSTVTGGNNNHAEGYSSTVSGGSANKASGAFSSISGGTNLNAPSYGEAVVGIFNETYTPNDSFAFHPNDRLFVVGNGTSNASRANALTILKNGKIGIGETIPISQLVVRKDSNDLFSNELVVKNRNTNAVGTGSRMVFQGYRDTNNNHEVASIEAHHQEGDLGNTVHGGALVFKTNSGDAPYPQQGAERMRITEDGNIGIGITNPKELLHVNGDYYGRGHLWFYAYEGEDSSGTAYVQARDKSGSSSIGLQLRTQDAGSLTEAMYIAPDGKIGMGITTPAEALEVDGTVKATAFIGDGSGLTGLPTGSGTGGTIQGTGTNSLNIRAANEGSVAGASRGDFSVDLQTARTYFLEVASGDYSVVSGGYRNQTDDDYATASGGFNNRAFGLGSTASGGKNNTAIGDFSNISGGQDNRSFNGYSTVSGGRENSAMKAYSTVAGGFDNQAEGDFSSISGGIGLEVYSYGEAAVGTFNQIDLATNSSVFNPNDNLFVVGNGISHNSRSNALTILKNGRIGIGSTDPKELLHVNGDYYGRGQLWFYAYEGEDSSGTAYVQARDKSGSSSIGLQLRTQDAGSPIDAMSIIPNGNVGIGTDIPLGRKLRVLGNTELDGKVYYTTGLLTGAIGGFDLVCVDVGNGKYEVRRQISSRRYKENIKPIGINAERLLDLDLKSWTGKSDSTGKIGIGYIAEEVDSLGLKELVIHNDKGQVESLVFSYFPFYSLEILKKHRQQIVDLEGQLKKSKAAYDNQKAEIEALKAQMKGMSDDLNAIMLTLSNQTLNSESDR